ncbi:hypothetical protein CA13_22770 [Planctomycetes bacterium CA13]|uniref:General secretion pathway protein K n=1 Tax=Novipirellula herctigrandis TaxID=2527986 RepID=A0A5C5Z1X6_9BACT|nr:hypothetical protein CA13_22770 [Planctomycetes bacterium CA13]
MTKPKQGMALLVVMVIVTLVALAAYGFNQQMTDAYRVSQLQIERAQARLTAMSAIEALKVTLMQPRGMRLNFHRDGLDSFAAVTIESIEGLGEQEDSVWSFSVVTPKNEFAIEASNRPEQNLPWRFGLSNESAKLNLLVLNQWENAESGQALKALMNLPGMDSAMAKAIMRVYQISGSSQTSTVTLTDRLGAASSEDSGDPAQWTRQWAKLYCGGDWDHNYRLDSLELALMGEQELGEANFSSIQQEPTVSTPAPVAWRDYVTLDSGQKNENLAGNRRVFLNGEDLQALHQQLTAIWPPEWANFVIAARQFGVSRGAASGGSSAISAAEWTPDFSIPAAERFSSPLELVGANVSIRQDNDKVKQMRSPFSDDFGDRTNYLRGLLEDVSVHPGPVIVGQVDVMDAPREVLLGVPGMSADVADQIVERRVSSAGTEATRDTIAWLWTENVIDLPTFIKLQPWLTVGGDCYHAQIVAFRDTLTPTFRCTVTLDGTTHEVITRNFRSWDAWGQGFTISDLRGEMSPEDNPNHADSYLP